MEVEKLNPETAQAKNEKFVAAKVESNIPAPTGVGKFKDMVVVKATAKHPTLAGQEYKVHSSQVGYLTAKGFIEKVVKKEVV